MVREFCKDHQEFLRLPHNHHRYIDNYPTQHMNGKIFYGCFYRMVLIPTILERYPIHEINFYFLKILIF